MAIALRPIVFLIIGVWYSDAVTSLDGEECVGRSDGACAAAQPAGEIDQTYLLQIKVQQEIRVHSANDVSDAEQFHAQAVPTEHGLGWENMSEIAHFETKNGLDNGALTEAANFSAGTGQEETQEASLAEVLRGVAEGRAAPVEVQDVLPQLVAVARSKALQASEQEVIEVITTIVDGNGDGLLDREELRLALGMGEVVGESDKDKNNDLQFTPDSGLNTPTPIPPIPKPGNASLAQLGGEAATRAWESYHCCDDFYASTYRGVFFKPFVKLAESIATPKACYLISHGLPGTNCAGSWFYSNSDPHDYSGSLCRCSHVDWDDLTFYVSGVGNDMFWVSR